jgi:hypothetical protein
MSAFWPVFDEANVMDFVRGHGADSPVPVRPISVETALAAKQKIQAFVDGIAALSLQDYPCRDAYLAYEQERLDAFDMILSATDPQAMARLNDRLFGELSSMGNAAVLAHLVRHVETTPAPSAATAVYRDIVLAGLADAERTGSVQPQFESINAYRLQLGPLVHRRYGFVTDLLDDYPGADTLSSEEVAAVLETAIQRILGAHAANWHAVVSKGAPNVFINYHRREVTIPAHRRYTKNHVDTLAVHEIGVHVLRSVNGDNSLERLAGLGLAGYGPAEEAFGVLLGNATKQTYHQINSLIPFAVIAYASRPEQPSFRQVYDFAKALIISLSNPDEATLKEKNTQYGRAAFSRTIRVLRMGDNSLIERSTTKYWRGQLLLAQHFDEHGLTQATFDEFFLGKYDCLQPKQLKLITHHTATGK